MYNLAAIKYHFRLLLSKLLKGYSFKKGIISNCYYIVLAYM